jgi:hypothetical protein
MVITPRLRGHKHECPYAPTILLALDPHSAVLSAAIKRQLQKLNSPQSHLIQTYTLTHNGQTFGYPRSRGMKDNIPYFLGGNIFLVLFSQLTG